ncbi:uncharacterized protein BXZ73DRAFT_91792 [Epithele typhae]|uniref:uncharacterized protein n=1 Tax=Epithele typhae TaxID=378194 RepID=UPI0020083E82|nr:uncharacterized protein BXZ73DRAFT_91792 [Epithele typhae]KAH9921530.1 hypothetical protein BXZ73DRAFT_91792 [Epithele typhae]
MTNLDVAVSETFLAARWDRLVLAGSVAALSAYALLRACARRGEGAGPVGPKSKDVASHRNAARAPGEWSAVEFDYPALEPSNARFDAVEPVPYRPFKRGAFHITMGIRNMPWDEWIELDRGFPHVHRVVEHRIRTRGDRLVCVNGEKPGIVRSGQAAAEELMYELAEYLSRRHPDVYSVARHPPSGDDSQNGWYGEGRIKQISIIPLGRTHDLDCEEPLRVARSLIQEDIDILIEGTDGLYYLQAGAMCIAGSWRIEDKLGMPLDEIHTSGHVPQFKERLQPSMERFFRRLPVDKPVVRTNYSFQVVQEPAARVPAPAPGSLLAIDPDELAWAATMNGSEDVSEYERAQHVLRDGPEREPVQATPRTVMLRTERQTLRRLPRTGAVVFLIRVHQTRVEDVLGEPGVPGRMASALRSWPEDVVKYKARAAFEGILPYLDAAHAEQLERGVVEPEDQMTTFTF